MINTEKQFTDTLAHYRARVELTLKNAIHDLNIATLLQEAMYTTALNGGKKLRPILVYATAACFCLPDESLDRIAAAVECIHCYSLIHDDLPAMDDDNLRRGKPTCHIAFGEATAILAGDAFQTLAFDLLSQPSSTPPSIQLKIIQTVASSAGAKGMVAGQSLDLLAEGKKLSEAELSHLHRLKTGALIQASVIMGALAAGCENVSTLNTLNQFADRLGLAFQLQDDLLDVTGNSKNLGKNTGQDEKHNKATYAILLGVEATRNRIHELMCEAKSLLQSLPHNTTQLQLLCDHLITREQ